MIVRDSVCTSTEDRKRLSRGSVERQVSHLQAITGTPCEVPVPKKVIFSNFGRLDAIHHKFNRTLLLWLSSIW